MKNYILSGVVLALAVVTAVAVVFPAFSVKAQDQLGVVASATTIPCKGSMVASKCVALDVQVPGMPDSMVYLKIFNPTVNQIGTVLIGTGGDGVSLTESIKSSTGEATGQEEISALVADGYQTVEMDFGTPFNNQQLGWQWNAGGLGLRAAANRYATAAQWAYSNLVATGTPLCATGNSAGSYLIAAGLSHYNLGSMLTLAELTSGPPFGAVNHACENDVPPSKSPCSGGKNGMGVATTQQQNFLDPAYNPSGQSLAACSTWSSLSTQLQSLYNAQFHNDSVDANASDSVSNYPNTLVNFVFGGKDMSSAIQQGYDYLNFVTSAKNVACVADAPHTIDQVHDGYLQIVNDIAQGCVLHPAKR